MPQQRALDPAYATTEDIMQAAKITRRTVTNWIDKGLLPEPKKVSHGYPLGAFNRFPASVLSRARFIASKRLEGLSLAAILELLNSEDNSGEKSAPRAKAASKRAKAKTATGKKRTKAKATTGKKRTKAKATSKRRHG